jgi:hypothetical protein
MPASTGPDYLVAGDTGHEQLLPLLLEICEAFFANTSTETRDELNALLRGRGITGGVDWLIDMLALTRLRLQNQRSSGNPPPPSEVLTSGIAPHHRQSAGENP